MDGLSNNPLLQPAYVTKVVDSIIPDTESFALTQEVPFRTQENEMVVVDVRQMMGGMTMAVHPGAESPIIEQRGVQQWSFMPAHFREKVLLSENDVKVIRRLGTASELERAQERITKILADLRMRVETRMEWSKWQMVYGSLAIDQPDVKFSIDYKIPTEFKPTLTGGDRWDQATSDPLEDMMNWIELYRDESTDPAFFQYNVKVEKLLLLNTKIRTLRDALFTGQPNMGNLTRDNLAVVINAYTGMQAKVYDKGYFFVLNLTSPITPVSTSFTVGENPGLVIGDIVTVIHKTGERVGRQRITLSGVTGTTLTHAAIGGAVTYPMGSEVRIKKHFIGDKSFIVRGVLPPGATGGRDWAEFISTNNVYGPGGIENPSPGIFSKVLVKNDDDPPRIEIIQGVSGLPVLYWTTINVIATTY